MDLAVLRASALREHHEREAALEARAERAQDARRLARLLRVERDVAGDVHAPAEERDLEEERAREEPEVEAEVGQPRCDVEHRAVVRHDDERAAFRVFLPLHGDLHAGAEENRVAPAGLDVAADPRAAQAEDRGDGKLDRDEDRRQRGHDPEEDGPHAAFLPAYRTRSSSSRSTRVSSGANQRATSPGRGP